MSENKPVVVALAVVGILIAGFVVYSITSDNSAPKVTSQQVDIPAPPPPVEAPEAVETPEPEVSPPPAEPEEEPVVESPAFVLPLLNDSDQLVRDGVISLTRNEGINAWLSPNQLIRKFVAFVDGVANGQVPKDPVRALAPKGAFSARRFSDDLYVMDEASYARYNFFVDIVTSIDSRRAAEFYDLIRPMLQEAYDELGYPDRKFDDVVFRAIGRLLETPVLTGPVRLKRPVVMFEYEDPKLESLSAAQKQLLRMGPENTRALQAKLSEMALELRAVLENG